MTKTTDLPREAQSGPIFHPDVGTHARVAYLASEKGLDALLSMVFPMPADTTRSRRALDTRVLKVEHDAGHWSVDVRHEMLSWQIAMRVSAVEVYLQDVLTFLALYDAEFMRSRDSKQTWDYDAIRSGSDSDISVAVFCNNWARAFVADGGPTRWTKSLERSGLGTFAAEDVAAMEEMWGYRHVRIHHGGRITREFASRNRSAAIRLCEDGLTPSDLDKWRAACGRVVESVEQSIIGRLRARLGEDLIAAREDVEFDRQLAEWDRRAKRMRKAESPEQIAERVARSKTEAENRFAQMNELFGPEPEGEKKA